MKSPCNKAQEVFTRVLLKYGLGCKLLSLNEADKSDISSVKWDATMSTKENIGDRHQMGKELCVYMHFDSQANTYQFQPEEYKAMMLDLWAELQKTGVSIGYSGTPLGDRAVPAEEGLATPFSYAAFRPFINRYGILLQDKYNPYEFEDPLQGVVIGLEDLIEAGIDIVAMRQMQQNRLNWLSQHIEKAEQSIRDEISQGDSNNVSKFLDYLEQMDKLEGNQLKGFLRDKQSELNEFVYLRCPRQFSNRIELPPIIGPLISLLSNETDEGKVESFINELKKTIPQLKMFVIEENDRIINDYMNHGEARNWLIKNNFIKNRTEKSDLKALVERDPYKMQVLFVRLVALANEKSELAKEQNQVMCKSFLDEKLDLQSTIASQIDAFNEPCMELISELEKLKPSPKNELYCIRVLDLTRRMVEEARKPSPDKKNLESMATQYQQLANNAPGASSTKKKIIGAMMIIGGIALACIGAAILAATLGFSSAASISAIAGGAGLVTAGTLTGAAGCGLSIFSRGHNAEKYMGKIAEETKKSSPK